MKKEIPVLITLLLFSTPILAQNIFVVNSTSDAGENNLADGFCWTGNNNSEGNQECTLRAALEQIADSPSPVLNLINFSLELSDPNQSNGIWTISPQSNFPGISFQILVQGTNQAGTVCGDLSEGGVHDLKIKIDGSAAPGDGFSLTGNFLQTIVGLSIGGFGDDGIHISGEGTKSVNCNYIGVDPDGVTATPNGNDGINLANFTDGAEISNNLISGNTQDGIQTGIIVSTDVNYIHGNIIGLDITGNTALPNRHGLSLFGTQALVVGELPNGNMEKNIISGNTGTGMTFGATGGSSNNRVIGNLFGTNVDGNAVIGNDAFGLFLGSGHNDNVIESNVIVGNGKSGISFGASNDNTVRNNLIGELNDGTPGGNSENGIYFGRIGSNNLIESNSISNNLEAGIFIFRDGNPTGWSFGNTFDANSIYSNSGLGIDIAPEGLNVVDVDDVDEGPNNDQNSPAISEILLNDLGGSTEITLLYSVDSDPANSTYPLTVQFFLADSDQDEGQVFLGESTYEDTDFNGFVAAGDKMDTIVYAGTVNYSDFISATATDAEGNTSEFSVTAADISLPVELANFEAVVNDGVLNLSWSTLSETNNAGFTIQTNDGSVWSDLAWVDGRGTTEQTSNYQFSSTDIHPGMTLVRLKQLDFDGSFAYSESLELKTDLPLFGELSEVYPNPSTNFASARYTAGVAGSVEISVYDLLGKRVDLVSNDEFQKGEYRELSLKVSEMPPGVYLLRVETEHSSEIRKLSVVR